MTDGDFTSLRELLRSIFKFYADSFRGASLTRTLIEKVVYEFKVGLPSDNALGKQLGFYWYLRGYFSDRLYACLEFMERQGEIQRTDNDLLMMPSRVMRSPIVRDEELGNQIQSFLPKLREYNPYVSVDDVITKHYLKFAPSPFCLAYSRRFLPALRYYLQALAEGRPMALGPRDFSKLARTRLEESTLGIPGDVHYSEFRRLYQLYERSVLRLIEYGSDQKLPATLVPETERLAESGWRLFCLFLPERAFDQSISYRLPDWKAEREGDVAEVGSQISH